MTNNAAKSFDILTTLITTSLSVLHNYFDSLTKLFPGLHLAKLLDISANCSFYVAAEF